VININIKYLDESERLVEIEASGEENIKIAEVVYDQFTA